MNIEDIKRILLQEEGIKIEFKKAKSAAPKSLYETVVSFSNTDGGTIVLGADNDGKVIGVENSSIGQIQTDIVTALNDRSCITPPPLFLQPEVIQHPDGALIALQIPASSQVHDHAGKIYIRESEADIDAYFQWLHLPYTAKEHLSSGMKNVHLPAQLARNNWEEILTYLVSNWNYYGYLIPEIKWPEKQPFIPEKDTSFGEKRYKLPDKMSADYLEVIGDLIKKVPSWSEKGTKLLAKRSMFLISILTLASAPIKREEIMEILGYGSRKSFNELYLNPLLKAQLIKRTNEENPRASNQQYYLTEKGKHFLGGTLS